VDAGVIDGDQLHFNEVIIENVPDDPYEYAKQLRPLLDQTANAAGRSTSAFFDPGGNFKLRVV
jgi:hypothetical protein